MSKVKVDVRRVDPHDPGGRRGTWAAGGTGGAGGAEEHLPHGLMADLSTARFFANLLDARFSILGFRVGLDPILGLLPVVGDVIAALSSLYIVRIVLRHKLGWGVAVLMLLNTLVDILLGAIPGIGDAADVIYKHNLINLKLLERAIERAYRIKL